MSASLDAAVESCRAFVDHDERSREAYIERLRAWPQARATIEQALNDLCANAPKPRQELSVCSFALYENFGAVQLRFGKEATEIVHRPGEWASSCGVRDGAALVFGQSESGRISVLFYPFILSLPHQEREARPTSHRVLDPAEVTRDLVFSIVRTWFNWLAPLGKENGRVATPTRIGFVFPEEGDGGEPDDAEDDGNYVAGDEAHVTA